MAGPQQSEQQVPASLRFGLACQRLAGTYRQLEGSTGVFTDAGVFVPPTTSELCELPGQGRAGPTYIGLSADRSFVRVVQPPSASVARVTTEFGLDPSRADAIEYRQDTDELVFHGRGGIRVAVRPSGPVM
jgi:hypothetical protein